MDRIVERGRLLWRDDSWRLAALLLVPTLFLSLIFDSPVDVLVGGAALVGLLAISTGRALRLPKEDPQGPNQGGSGV